MTTQTMTKTSNNPMGKWAIPTVYRGVQMRSKLEAQWAEWFDRTWPEHPWEYEAEGYDFDGVRYLPDFYVPTANLYIEAKGVMTGADLAKIERLTRAACAVGRSVLVAMGRPGRDAVLMRCNPSPSHWHESWDPWLGFLTIQDYAEHFPFMLDLCRNDEFDSHEAHMARANEPLRSVTVEPGGFYTGTRYLGHIPEDRPQGFWLVECAKCKRPTLTGNAKGDGCPVCDLSGRPSFRPGIGAMDAGMRSAFVDTLCRVHAAASAVVAEPRGAPRIERLSPCCVTAETPDLAAVQKAGGRGCITTSTQAECEFESLRWEIGAALRSHDTPHLAGPLHVGLANRVVHGNQDMRRGAREALAFIAFARACGIPVPE